MQSVTAKYHVLFHILTDLGADADTNVVIDKHDVEEGVSAIINTRTVIRSLAVLFPFATIHGEKLPREFPL